MTETVYISDDVMASEFHRILLKYNFAAEKAEQCTHIFTQNSLDGIYSHGVNRFARFVRYIQNGYIVIDAEPELRASAGAVEQWDGHMGPGPLNALFCTEQVLKLAKDFGIGCVTLANTNHWMRAGFYGWKAAQAGFVFISWTNTIANMPAWGSSESRLGNNPLVFAVPYDSEAIVLDMAMSQFSYGSMKVSALKKQQLPVPGGYDENGRLTTQPEEILASERTLPIGYWKGAGLSLLLDLLATVLSGGRSTAELSEREHEYGMSQIYIAIDIAKLHNYKFISQTVNSIVENYLESQPLDDTAEIFYPGKRVLQVRRENKVKGIPVIKSVWDEILGF